MPQLNQTKITRTSTLVLLSNPVPRTVCECFKWPPPTKSLSRLILGPKQIPSQRTHTYGRCKLIKYLRCTRFICPSPPNHLVWCLSGSMHDNDTINYTRLSYTQGVALQLHTEMGAIIRVYMAYLGSVFKKIT